MALEGQTGTYTLANEVLKIDKEDGITAVAMRLVSGIVTFKGSLPIDNKDSNPITLRPNEPVTVEFNHPIGGFTIDATLGSVDVLLGRP